MNLGNIKIQKFISSLLIFSMFIPALFVFSLPKQAKADPWGVPISDIILETSTGISAGVDATTVAPVTWKNVAKEILRQFLMLLARRLLAQLTQSVVNWINLGYWGNPLFVEDPKSFFNDIAKYEIRTFVDLTGYDYLRFPFGKDFALELIDSSQRQLDENLEYSLSKVFTDPYLESRFRSNFEVGGWNGFLINTQYPQNNYLGYRMLATEAMLRKLDGTATNAANKVRDTLAQGMGFLSPQTCADNNGNNEYNKVILNQFKRPSFDIAAYSREHPFDAVRAETDYAYEQQWDAELRAAKAAWGVKNTCRNLVATTPGSVIANQVTGSLSSNRVNKELAAAMGNSIAAILDAFIGKFMNKGLRALSNAINPNDQDKGVTQDNFSDPIYGTIGGAIDRSGQTYGGGSGGTTPIPTYDQCVANCNAAVEFGIDATSCIEISCSSLLPADDAGGGNGGGGGGTIPGGSLGNGTGFGNDIFNPPSIASNLSNIVWEDTNVSGWAETANLSASTDGSSVNLNSDKTNVWPAGFPLDSVTTLNANAWIFVYRNGSWHASTWDWMRPGQTNKDASNLYQPDAAGTLRGSLTDFSPQGGDTYGFMVSCLARSSTRNCTERSNVVMTTWPGGSGNSGGGGSGGTQFSSLQSAVQSERAKYPASFAGLCGSSGLEDASCPLGKILNAVAWNNRANGWGVNRKTGGHRCPSPAGEIACDILHHQPTNIIVDVFVASETNATPTWDVLGPMTDNNRPWVAPAQP